MEMATLLVATKARAQSDANGPGFTLRIENSNLSQFVERLTNPDNRIQPRKSVANYLLNHLPPKNYGEIYDYQNGNHSEDLAGDLSEALCSITENGKSIIYLCGLGQSDVAATTWQLYNRGPHGDGLTVLNMMVLCDSFKELTMEPSPPIQQKKDKILNQAAKDKAVAKLAKDLDSIDLSAQEWGRASISDIAIIDGRTNDGTNGFFALQYVRPTEFYMDQARANVQGTASLTVNQQNTTMLNAQYGSMLAMATNALPVLGATGTNSPGGSTNAGGANGSSTNAASASTNSAPSSSATNITALTSPTNAAPAATNAAATASTATTNNTATVSAQTNMAPQLSENVVLKVGATDKITERILNYMSDPVDLPDNKKAYLGIMQVSMLPGWRTKKGYICEVQVSFEYAVSKKRAQQINSKNNFPEKDEEITGIVRSSSDQAHILGLPMAVPSIISAFPFAEAQILDLNSSFQRQLSFLTTLSGIVPTKLQATLMNAYTKMVQQNVATRSPLPLVVPSSQGADVTYRFDPELQALVDPAKASSGSGHVLEPSSFPALFVIICDADELITWDMISESVETKWIPVTHRHWFKRAALDWWYYDSLPEKPFHDAERLKNARAFDSVFDDMVEMLGAGVKRHDFIFMETERRYKNLQTAALGHTFDSYLPLLRPRVTAIYPDEFRCDFVPPELTIQGHYFHSSLTDVKYVGLGGKELDVLSSDNNSITVGIPSKQRKLLAPGIYPIDIVTDAGKTRWSNAIHVLPVPEPSITSIVAGTIHEPTDPTTGMAAGQVEPLTVIGQHLLTGDDSLKLALGNVILDPKTAIFKSVEEKSISLELKTDALNLKPGRYNFTVFTSGGSHVMSNAVEVAYRSPLDQVRPPAVVPAVTSVYPDTFRLDALPEGMNIVGNFFEKPAPVKFAELGGFEMDILHGDNRSMTVELPDDLKATNYDLILVNQAGRTVMTNAVHILPTPPPLVNAMLPGLLKIDEAHPAAAPAPVIIKGENFDVQDSSLEAVVGGIPLLSPQNLTGKSLIINVDTDDLQKKLAAGKYNLTIMTSGGQATLTNVVEITKKQTVPADGSVQIDGIYPTHGFLYSTTVFILTGKNFDPQGNSKITRVTIGGRECEIKYLSNTALVVALPAWSHLGFTNNVSLGTNKLDVVVMSPAGVNASLSNAVEFDLTLPNDARRPVPQTPEEDKVEKMLDAILYASRVMGTNPVMKTDFTLSASAGAGASKASDKERAGMPPIMASIHIGTNEPASDEPASSAAKSKGATASP